MKIMYLTLIVGAMGLASCTEQPDPNKLHLTGSLENMGDTLIAQVMSNEGKTISTDTILVKNGQIDAQIALDKVAQIYLSKPSASNEFISMIYGVPGETCQLSGTWEDTKVNGSQFYADYKKMNDAFEPTMKKVMDFQKKIEEMMEKNESQEAISEFYEKEGTPLLEGVNKLIKDYIQQNPKSEACATLISNFDGDELKEVLGYLDESVKTGRMKAILSPLIEKMEKMEKVSEGHEAPAIELKDLNGKTLTLKSLRGKYVILDFWGSWCGWCIKGFPQMKEYYNKYKGQFEILGIDCGDEEDAWKAAVAEHQLPWKHVYNPKESTLTEVYAIQGYPTKIVIDPEGKIAKVIVGEDPAFYEYLDATFGK